MINADSRSRSQSVSWSQNRKRYDTLMKNSLPSLIISGPVFTPPSRIWSRWPVTVRGSVDWCCLESVGAAAVVERIEHHFHGIIPVEALAPGFMRPYLAGIVMANKNNVEISLVVSEIGFRGLGDRLTVLRLALQKTL